MNKVKSIVLTIILLIANCQAVLPAENFTFIEPKDALVLVMTRSFMGGHVGNGFVIGNGTLVVTAHHLVFRESRQGQHQMSGLVFVASRYLGDACEAKIVAAEEELDLAVLEIPWKGHPALRLVDESELLSAERLVVMGIPETIRSIGRSGHEPLMESLNGQSEDLAIDFVALRQHIPRFISLSGIGQLSGGWSGSPMLLPNTSVAAGCFTLLHTERGNAIGGRGPAVTQVRRLLKQSCWEKSVVPSDSYLSRCGDGMDALILLAQAYHHFAHNQYGQASDRIEKFISLRPKSFFGYTLSAMITEKQGRYDLSEQHHKKAVELNSEGMGPQLYYAQFLSNRRPDEALKILETMWHVDEWKPAVALLMSGILFKREQFQRASEPLIAAMKVNPRNAYLRMNLGSCQYKLDKLDEAIANYTIAVELLPERGPFRGRLAHLLEETNKFDEAEKHYRELLKIEPNNPVVYVWLAQFLAKYRPQARDEALKVAQTALKLPPRKSLPRQKIEQIIQELHSQTEPAP